MSELFNSYTNPIPPLRRDVQAVPVEQNGESFLYFYDQMGYATPDFAVPKSAETIFSLFDGRKSVEDIMKFSAEGITRERVLEYVQFLDQHALLNSKYFKSRKEEVEEDYESSEVHPSATAGYSYPEDPEELAEFLGEAFDKLADEQTGKHTGKNIRALYAPHIDIRVGLDSYVEAFSAIRHLKPKRVVLLATSHYSGLYPEQYETRPFVFTEKDFEMVNGKIPADREALNKIKDQLDNDDKREAHGVSFADRAHRLEHSIELHLVFLNHIWNHDFKLVPLVVGGLEELFYMENGHQGQQTARFARLINSMFAGDKDTFFLISGDLAHVGKKFGDQDPANELLPDVHDFDQSFMEAAATGKSSALLSVMKQNYDLYKICGYPPLYTFMKMLPGLSGHKISYDTWDEAERESAVTFGSILYEKGK